MHYSIPDKPANPLFSTYLCIHCHAFNEAASPHFNSLSALKKLHPLATQCTCVLDKHRSAADNQTRTDQYTERSAKRALASTSLALLLGGSATTVCDKFQLGTCLGFRFDRQCGRAHNGPSRPICALPALFAGSKNCQNGSKCRYQQGAASSSGYAPHPPSRHSRGPINTNIATKPRATE